MPETPPSEYERGKAAGQVEQRLDVIERHSRDINGSIERTGAQLAALTGELRALRDELHHDKAVLTADTQLVRTDLTADLLTERLFRTRWRARCFASGFMATGIGAGVVLCLALHG